MKPLSQRPCHAARLAVAAIILGFYPQADAAMVTGAGDVNNAPGTLRTVIKQAAPGAVINFDPNLAGNTITLDPLLGELVIDKDLAISGLGATKLSVVNANGRVFHIKPPNLQHVSVQISGLGLQGKLLGNNGGIGVNGDSVQGGCIFNEQFGSLNVTNCYFRDCQAKAGRGGDAANSGSAAGPGGAAAGGAIDSEGDLVVYGCTFSNNSATGGDGGNGGSGVIGGPGAGGGPADGGAIYMGYNGGQLGILDSTFVGNYAYGGNGGKGGTGFGNINQQNPANGGPGGKGADASGGGIYIYRACDSPDCNGALGIVHSTISQNVCSPGVGGVGGPGSFGGNTGATGANGAAEGCGLWRGPVNGDMLPVGNTIIAVNYPIPTTISAGGPDVRGVILSQRYNLIGAEDTFSSGWIAGFELFGTVASPLNPRLGSLQNNGGETPTMAPLINSPAIDAGNTGGLGTDQAGQHRPVPLTGPMNGGDASDIGAYELQSPPTNSPVTLTITPSGSNIIVSWPAPSTGYKLQENPGLNPLSWVETTHSINMSGTQNQIIVNPVGNRFYRLFHP